MRASISAELDTADRDWVGQIARPNRGLDLGQISSIWWRRPTSFVFPDELTAEERTFARDEATAGLGGLLRLQDCFWMNHPERAASAEFKPLQLKRAKACGFTIPRSIITNDHGRALAFLKRNTECGLATIYKTLAFPTVMNPVSGQEDVIYTTRVTEDQLDGAKIGMAPCLFQEEVPKALELRCTIVGDRVLSAGIDASQSARGELDFRTGYGELRYLHHTLPTEVESRLVRFAGSLGLAFGAADLILKPDGEYVFLEVNPGGQWAWLEGELGLPISAAIADALTGV